MTVTMGCSINPRVVQWAADATAATEAPVHDFRAWFNDVRVRRAAGDADGWGGWSNGGPDTHTGGTNWETVQLKFGNTTIAVFSNGAIIVDYLKNLVKHVRLAATGRVKLGEIITAAKPERQQRRVWSRALIHAI